MTSVPLVTLNGETTGAGRPGRLSARYELDCVPGEVAGALQANVAVPP